MDSSSRTKRHHHHSYSSSSKRQKRSDEKEEDVYELITERISYYVPVNGLVTNLGDESKKLVLSLAKYFRRITVFVKDDVQIASNLIHVFDGHDEQIKQGMNNVFKEKHDIVIYKPKYLPFFMFNQIYRFSYDEKKSKDLLQKTELDIPEMINKLKGLTRYIALILPENYDINSAIPLGTNINLLEANYYKHSEKVMMILEYPECIILLYIYVYTYRLYFIMPKFRKN